MLGSLYSAAARTRSSRWSRSISWFRESTFAFCLAILSFHSSAIFWRAAAAAAAEESTAAAFFPALPSAPGGGPATLSPSLGGRVALSWSGLAAAAAAEESTAAAFFPALPSAPGGGPTTLRVSLVGRLSLS